jgi:iron complex outermembrane receptor protein
LTDDWRWDLGGNITFNQNKITKLTSSSDSSYIGVPTGNISGGVGSRIQINSVGHPTNTFYVYKQLYDVNGKPIEGQYADLNNDGKITDADLYRTKQPAPKIIIGATTAVSYKDFSFSTVVRGSFGNYMYDNITSANGTVNSALIGADYLSNISQTYYEHRFSGRLKSPNDNSKLLLSDIFIKNASFVKIDNMSLAYDLRSLINSDTYGCVVSFNVQNVATFTKFVGIDPEIFNGINNNFYPRPRTYTVGLNFRF